MHHALIREIKRITKVGTCRDMLPGIYNSGHVVISHDVLAHARKWKRKSAEDARLTLPSSALPQFRKMTLVIHDEGGAAPYWVLQENDGGVAVISISEGYLVKLGKYWPGSNEVEVETGSPVGSLNAALSSVSDEQKMSIVATVAFIVATMNTPGLVRSNTARPNAVDRGKVRKLLGRAALAWTNVDIVPGALRDGMHNPAHDVGRTIALHRRRGNFAWIPSQRETPKAVWLSSEEAPLRGAGWYVWREERLVGSEAVGVKVQRHIARMPGERRPEIAEAMLDAKDTVQQAVLSAVQRALIARDSAMISVALH